MSPKDRAMVQRYSAPTIASHQTARYDGAVWGPLSGQDGVRLRQFLLRFTLHRRAIHQFSQDAKSTIRIGTSFTFVPTVSPRGSEHASRRFSRQFSME